MNSMVSDIFTVEAIDYFSSKGISRFFPICKLANDNPNQNGQKQLPKACKDSYLLFHKH